jgi:UPF0755 protein
MRRAFGFVLVLALLAGGATLWARQRLVTPYRGFAGSEQFVEIQPGMGVSAIAERLADAGVVADRVTFRLAARLAGADRSLQAGEYRFTEPATPGAIVDRLARGDVFARAVTFPEGLTIAEMAPLFERSGLGTADEFLDAATDTSRVAELDHDARSLEGYLFPSTYTLPRRAGAEGAVAAMVAQFRRVYDQAVARDAEERGLTPREVVILASLIEKETARDDERALVSAVYHNRLALGMPLQCDPTVIYAMMRAGRWNGNIRRADLQMDSPYNTYRYPGLPPGPIASPGRASLEAAVRPAKVKFLYFVSRNDGSHVFASSLAEHNRNVVIWQRRRP